MIKKIFFVSALLIFSSLAHTTVHVSALDPSLLLFNECHDKSLRISYLSITKGDMSLASLPEPAKKLLNNSHIIVQEQSTSSTNTENLSPLLDNKYQSQHIALTRKQKQQKSALQQEVLIRQQLNASKAYRPHPLLGSFDPAPWVLNFDFSGKRLVLSSTIASQKQNSPQPDEVAAVQKFLASTKRPSIFILGNGQASALPIPGSKIVGHHWWLLDTLRSCKNQEIISESFSLSSIQFSEF